MHFEDGFIGLLAINVTKMKLSPIKILRVIFTFLLISVLFTGCIKEEFDSSKFDASAEIQSGIAIPIGFSHMGFGELLSKVNPGEELRIGEDGFLSLYYPAAIDSGVMGKLISISYARVNRSVLNRTGSVLSLSSPGNSIEISDSIVIPVTLAQADARIDSIKMFSMALMVEISPVNLTGTISYRLNGLRKNGVPFTLTRSLANPGFNLSLENFTIIPDHDVSENNLLTCHITIQLEYPSGPVNPGSPLLNLNATMSDARYETIYGDYEEYTINLPAQIIPISFFRHQTLGQFYLKDPSVKLFFSNSVGVPLGLSFSRVDAIDRDGNRYPLTGPGIPGPDKPRIIGYPKLNQEGQTIHDSLVIDANNSNLAEIIAHSPNSMELNASAGIVKLTPSSTTFINHDSKYNISAAIELPLWGKGDILVLFDTLHFNYTSSLLPLPDEIEKLVLRTSIINSFPVTTHPQLYLLDRNRILIDSIFTGTEKVEGALDTNGDGMADPRKQPPIDIDLSRSVIDNLQNTRYIVARAAFKTTDFPDQDVKLFSSYFIKYNVGLIATLKTNAGK